MPEPEETSQPEPTPTTKNPTFIFGDYQQKGARNSIVVVRGPGKQAKRNEIINGERIMKLMVKKEMVIMTKCKIPADSATE